MIAPPAFPHAAFFYTAKDVAGGLWATLVFALALVSPGYCVGWAADLCGFRRAGLRERLAWSLLLSLGVGTLPLVGLVARGGVTAGAWALVLLGVGAAALAFLEAGRWQPVRRVTRLGLTRKELRWAGLLAVLWTLLVLGSLVDFGVGQRLWLSVTTYDHALRTNFVSAVLRSGVPPANPLYWPGAAVSGSGAPMRYYYFWYVVCAVVARVAHVSARQALMASCVWTLPAVGAALALYWRYFLGLPGHALRGTALRSRWLVSLALLGVTGLDLLAFAGQHLAGEPLFGDPEWWSVDQVSSWLDTFLWAPHHAASLVCCLLALLLLQLAVTVEPRGGRRTLLAVLAGISLASGFGLSVYLPTAMAAVLLAWLALQMGHAQARRPALVASCVTVVTALPLLLPFLRQLARREPASAGAAAAPATASPAQAVAGPAPAAHVLRLGFRHILDPEGLASVLAHGPLAAHPAVAHVAASLLLLPVGYAVEFGFFAVVLLVAQWGPWRLRAPAPEQGGADPFRTLVVLTWVGLAVSSFVRSDVIAANDFGIRGSLLPQFFLLLLAVPVLEGVQRTAPRGWLRRVLLATAALGLCGTVVQLVDLRLFLPWEEHQGSPEARGLAERTYTLRALYAAFDRIAPASARLEYNPYLQGYFMRANLLPIDRQVITAEQNCNAAFGGPEAACAGVQAEVNRLFPADPFARPVSAAVAGALCQQLGIQDLVATQWDPVWADRDGWVWHLPAVAEVPGARVVACGAAQTLGSPT